MTRWVKNPQMQIGEMDISQIRFDPKSRDDIPQVLRGLQHIYMNLSLREKIFVLLETHIAPKVNKKNGRPGMELWKILVMGVLRLDLKWDYDRLHYEINNQKQIRQMLGHPDFSDEYYYHLQTIKDNVCLLTPELLDEINQVVVQAGHGLLKKKENAVLRGRCDSFVVETNVHYPTDINLLWDAMRKVMELTARLCIQYGRSDFRQSVYTMKQMKRLLRIVQSKKRYRGRTEEQKKKQSQIIKQAHRDYMAMAKRYLSKACFILETLKEQGFLTIEDAILVETVEQFIYHAERQIDQIHRRVLQGEKIPHQEKVFSLFEPHTEWISKGKAGVPQELGLRVCVMEDQYQFILYHQVMEKQTDDKVTVSMSRESRKRFSDLKVISFDKGFHSPKNQEILSEELELLALPRKGRLSQAAKAIETSEEFRQARIHHAAVESAINALEVHGLDRCPDRGIHAFKRYVALAIVARNIQRLGAVLQKQEQKRLQRKKKKYCRQTMALKLAA
jgi:transposase, IS5 family